MGSQAGRNERLLYRTVATMVENRQHDQRLWGTPTEMSSTYRMCRQILEDRMHSCVMLWMANQRVHAAGARAYYFFYMGTVITAVQQLNWFHMAKALTSVLARSTLRAVSRWLYSMRLDTQGSAR